MSISLGSAPIQLPAYLRNQVDPLVNPLSVLSQKLALYMNRDDLSAERAPQGMAQVTVG